MDEIETLKLARRDEGYAPGSREGEGHEHNILKTELLIAGALCGVIAAILAVAGNPANMAFCIACFIRDTAGAMKFHSAAAVQYARPEIVGLILGAFIISALTKEYRSTAGSSPMIRFVLGMIIMIGALVFLGCPLRMVLRMSAGDLNAYVALVGFICGVGTGSLALRTASAWDVPMTRTRRAARSSR